MTSSVCVSTDLLNSLGDLLIGRLATLHKEGKSFENIKDALGSVLCQGQFKKNAWKRMNKHTLLHLLFCIHRDSDYIKSLKTKKDIVQAIVKIIK